MSNPPEARIIKDTIKDQAAVYIRNNILTGAIKPGQRILPGDLAEELDTGRGVVREALIQLEGEGLVKNIPYRGSFVAVLDPSELYEICSIRVLLESYAIDNIQGPISQEDFQAIDEILEEMKIAVAHHRLDDIVRLDAQFHGYFVKKVSHSVLYDAWSITNAKLATLFHSSLSNGFPAAQIAENHRALTELLHHTSFDEYKACLVGHYLTLPKYGCPPRPSNAPHTSCDGAEGDKNSDVH